MLVIKNLTKTYRNGTSALKNINLDIPAGMFGLLGPNGAGKSSLMRTIVTLQEPDSGEILLDGTSVLHNKMEVRKTLGYLPQDFGLYPHINAVDLLTHIAVLKGITDRSQRRERVDALLHKVNLYEHRHKPLDTFSGGMRQRFGIAQALISHPRLIVVDEPTAGLDPGERNRFYNLLAGIGEHAIVILSTHIVEDVRQLCTRMAILCRGEVLVCGSPTDIVNDLTGRVWTRQLDDGLPAEAEQWQVLSTSLVGGKTIVRVQSEAPPSDAFERAEANLEDAFFSTISGWQPFK